MLNSIFEGNLDFLEHSCFFDKESFLDIPGQGEGRTSTLNPLEPKHFKPFT